MRTSLDIGERCMLVEQGQQRLIVAGDQAGHVSWRITEQV